MDVTFPEMRYSGMETSLQKRLKIRMDLTGMNAFETAKKAGLGESFVRDILRGKSKNPGIEKLERLAAALDTTVEWFTSADEGKAAARPAPAVGGLDVIGSIQAGNWVDRSIIEEPYEREIIPVARDPRFPHAKQYALEVIGDSMDKEYPEGCYVTCVDYWDSGLSIKDGLILHVERHNGALVEMTLKAVETIDGAQMLVPRSSNPKHKPFRAEGEPGAEVVVKGVVTGSYRRTII